MVLNKFIRGRQSPEGYPCSSRPSDAMNQLSATAMQSCMVLENLRVGLMASAVAHKKSHISTVSVKQTIPQSFRVLNVSALWVCQNLSAYDRCQWVASSQELLVEFIHKVTLFCRRLVTEDKLWIYEWDPLNKLEFMQWKDVDCPTFTSMCNSVIYWLTMATVFFWDKDGLLMADYLHPGKTTRPTGQYYAEPTFKLLDVIKQKH